MDKVSIYTSDSWSNSFGENEKKKSLIDLESGKILYFPQLCFNLYPEEQPWLVACATNKKNKNISFNIKTDTLKGIQGTRKYQLQLKNILVRFSQQATTFMQALFPHYANTLVIGRTSYRPSQIKNRITSPRKDDTRLHVDAFPASPNQGKRIFRVFCNINPYGEHRVWRVGEPFPAVAQHFLPKIPKPLPGSAKFLYYTGITKSIRSYYDHIMLQIHDRMKLDTDYQKQVKYTELRFPSGSSWIVSTDQVSHAAISGQYVLEQTFYLPVNAMKTPATAPLHVLESLKGHRLT